MPRETPDGGGYADDQAQAFCRATDRLAPCASENPDDSEVLDDGQEEVFSRTAIENGAVEDPKALGPEDLARVSLSRTPSGKA
ncbi:hypothetical protein [Phenylobacterium sp.]|uniref:hypothetical protein n=1 Tax=Phenylobacterium sp. TaxID=1871053 RepID=UPI0025E88AD2|nr:hypothetical protein [Phenylobacterium sp.]